MTPTYIILEHGNGSLANTKSVSEHATKEDAFAEAIELKSKTPTLNYTIAQAQYRVEPGPNPYHVVQIGKVQQ